MVNKDSKTCWKVLQEVLPADTLGQFMFLVSRNQKKLLHKFYDKHSLPKEARDIMDMSFDAAFEEYKSKSA